MTAIRSCSNSDKRMTKKRVLDNLPVNVNGVILVIKEPDSFDMIDFTMVPFLVYGPWLRRASSFEKCYEMVLKKSQNGARECEKAHECSILHRA